MTRRILSATFDSRDQAERAVADLKAAGVEDRDISVLHRDTDVHGRDHADSKASGAAKGAGIGAGVGALAGLGALAIPGVGPFLAMGAIVETIGVIGSAAATSAVVGATAGGLAGALMDYGVGEEESRHIERRLGEGAVWVGVDARSSAIDETIIARIFNSAGGETALSARAPAY